MTLAVLCTSTGSALDPADATRLAGDLSDALTRAGASRVERLPSGMGQLAEIARIAHASAEPLLICADNLVTHPALLWMLATEPGGQSAALVTPNDRGDLGVDGGRLRRGGRTVTFAGALYVARDDLVRLATTADRLSARARTPDGILATDVRTALDLLLSALLEAGPAPFATLAGELHAERVITPAQLAAARAAVAAVDEDAARLRMAAGDPDDFFATYAVGTWSGRLVRPFARLRLPPIAVTGLSVVAAVLAALCFADASRPAMIGGAVLVYAGFGLSRVAGQLARFTRRAGPGGWVEAVAGRAAEYVVYAGLATGATRHGLDHAWLPAVTAVGLQTVRHATDAWSRRLGPEPGAAGPPGSVRYWLDRVARFPAGERSAVITLVALVFDGRVVLATLVLGQVASLGWTLVRRVTRAVARRTSMPPDLGLARYRDDGYLVRTYLSRAGGPLPLATALIAVAAALGVVVALLTGALPHGAWPQRALPLTGITVLVLVGGVSARAAHTGRLDGLVPAALRAAEYLMVGAVGVIGAVPGPLVFLLIVLLALRHDDGIARLTTGPEWVGWDGRVLFLWLTTLLTVPTGGVALLAVGVGADLAYGIVRSRSGMTRDRAARTGHKGN